MKSIIFVLFFMMTAKGYSQSVRFSSLSWRDALAKAKAEKKMLFVEMYTPWCTYCKQMERDVFTAEKAGDFYNAHFINVRYDATKSDGILIRRSYAMLGFPTFLYLNENGLVLMKTAGYQEKDKFLSNGDSAVAVWLKKQIN